MKPHAINFVLAISFLVIAGLGCKTMSEGKPAAEQAVKRFHRMVAEERYEEIYDQSAGQMKGAATKEDLVKLFRTVNAKLGKVVSTDTQGVLAISIWSHQ